MSKQVDSRIVEMRFDNKQFESGAKTTMSTLTKLKEALKLPNTSKALEGIDKAVKGIKLDGIAAGVEALERRFSTMGIVGMRVIENITDGLMSKVRGAVNVVSDSIVSGGIKRAMNIENAHFQLQSLLKDETKVQAIMSNAMEAVDGTAYAYDEAAKAASQFAASGLQAGDDMLNALKGITGVAAMTNSSFEDISRVFTTVAGNGRLMGDQLLQLSSRGLNAASTLADYFREVRGNSKMTEATIRDMVSKGKISFKDFSDAMTWAFGDSAKRANETFTGAMSNMKSALARIGAEFVSPLVEQNGELVQLFNALRIKINDFKSSLTFNEQRSAISGLVEVTKMSTDELTAMFETIKTNGKVSVGDLDSLASKGADATKALEKYVNGVMDGTIRSSYAISTALNSLTQGTKVSTDDIRRFVEEGKIDLATFTSAMEKEFGNEKTLSKQFTDFFLDNVHKITQAVNSADITKPMEIFYIWVESVKNLVKGLLSVIKPVGKAFADVFLSFSADDVITFSEGVERLTAKMKLSEKGSKNLHDAFQGLFSIVKLVIDVFFTLFGAVLPINKPVVEMSGGILGLAGAMGRGLTKFTEMIRSCKLLQGAFNLLSKGFSIGINGLTSLIKVSKKFTSSIFKMENATKIIDKVNSAFDKLYSKASPYINSFTSEVEDMVKSLLNIEDITVDEILNGISNAFSNLYSEVKNLSFDDIEGSFEKLTQKVKSLRDLLNSNEDLTSFIGNAKQFGEDLKEAFTWDNLMARLEKIMDVFGKFFNWIKTTLGPAFEDFNVGTAVGAGSAVTLIYTLAKGSKAFESLASSIKSIPDVLGGVKGTLEAYQKDLKASAILKIALAIGVLAGSLVLLSFTNTAKLMDAAIALSLVAGVLMLGVAAILGAVNKGKEMSNALNTFSSGLSKSMKKLSTAVQIKAIGGAIKDFAKSIAIVAVSIIALGVMYSKDPEGFKAGTNAVTVIGIALGAIVAIFAVLGKKLKSGAENFSAVAKATLMMSLSVMVIVAALNKLFKMTLPDDWETKVGILGGVMVGLAVLALILGLAGRIAGGGSASGMAGMKLPSGLKWAKSISTSSSGGSLSSGPILATAGALYVIVAALNKLFKMTLPDDWEEKVTILAGIMLGLGVLMIAMGVASKKAGGAMKAGGTILAMALFVAVIVGALMILAAIPGDELMKGAKSLGLVLTTLGIALYGAGKITNKETNKSILAMAIVVGAIVASLAILAMIPFSDLLKGIVSLGSILLVLAIDFNQIAKITNDKAWLTITAMIAAILAIAYSLYTLAEQPWEGLIAGAAGLSAVLLALTYSFKIISEVEISVKTLGKFLLMLVSLAGVGAALYFLAEQPWEGLLAGGIALSAVLLALSGAFLIISTANPNLKAIGAFVAAAASVDIIAIGLYKLAEKDWQSLLAAAESLSLVLVSMSAAMGICAVVGQTIGGGAIEGLVLLDLFIANLALVLAALGGLTKIKGLKELMSDGADLLVQIGKALGDFVGAIVSGTLTTISAALPQVGEDLSKFMENLSGFIEGSKQLKGDAVKNVGLLALAISALSAAEVIAGLARFASLGTYTMKDMGTELSDFMGELGGFIEGAEDLTPEMVDACLSLSKMILALTVADVIKGVTDLLGIGGSFAEFGEELSAFGDPIKEFADKVKDVDPDSVKGAAAAGEIMANLAKKLPAQSGLANAIFGDHSLKEFGEELASFAPDLVDFAGQVEGITPAMVEGAAAAAELMAELANKLPPQDGLIQAIFGEKSLEDFGEQLVSFGPDIVRFADKVKNVNPTSVIGCSTVTTIMTNLANNLPDTKSLWNKIFGGGQVTLSEFGEELVDFGESMVDFSDTVDDFDAKQVTDSIDSFKNLIDLANYAKDKSADSLKKFTNSLSKVGTDSVNDFVKSFKGADKKVSKQVDSLMSSATESVKTGGKDVRSEAERIGNNLCNSFSTGISDKIETVTKAVLSITSEIVNKFKSGLSTELFNKRGKEIVQALIDGIEGKENEVKSAASKTCETLTRTFMNNLTQDTFKEIGVNAALGLQYGIESKNKDVMNTAINLANTAAKSVQKTLDEHSPSKRLFKMGQFFDLGLIGGILDLLKMVSSAGKKAADEAVEPVEKATNDISSIINSSDFNADPVIRPVIDLSDVQKGADEINSLMDQTYTLTATRNLAMDAHSTFTRNKRTKDNNLEDADTKDQNKNGGDTYEFNQYNYSPKALTRSEIYRQTNNQFSAFKRVVKPT